MDPVKTFAAHCTTCKATYSVEINADQRKRVSAAAGNRQVWMETHADTTGHHRFRTDDGFVAYHIVSRGQSPQGLLSDDPNYSTFRL